MSWNNEKHYMFYYTLLKPLAAVNIWNLISFIFKFPQEIGIEMQYLHKAMELGFSRWPHNADKAQRQLRQILLSNGDVFICECFIDKNIIHNHSWYCLSYLSY